LTKDIENPPSQLKSSSEDDGYENLSANGSTEDKAVRCEGDEEDESSSIENDNTCNLSASQSLWTISTPLIEISELLDDDSTRNEEKIYEDLCYVTFSNSREVYNISFN
jgi:hypothetical protein